MPAKTNPKISEPVRPGRRFALDFDSPRDQTVCFTVSKEEKAAVDAMAGLLRRTRSSVLARIVVSFIDDAERGGDPEGLRSLLEEYSALKLKNGGRE